MSAIDRIPDPLPTGEGPAGPPGPSKVALAPADRPPLAEWLPVAVVAAVVALAYWPNLNSLVGTWNREPDYSHGYLVIPIALAILYRLWPAGADRSGSLVGWGVVVASLAARFYLFQKGSLWA